MSLDIMPMMMDFTLVLTCAPAWRPISAGLQPEEPVSNCPPV